MFKQVGLQPGEPLWRKQATTRIEDASSLPAAPKHGHPPPHCVFSGQLLGDQPVHALKPISWHCGFSRTGLGFGKSFPGILSLVQLGLRVLVKSGRQQRRPLRLAMSLRMQFTFIHVEERGELHSLFGSDESRGMCLTCHAATQSLHTEGRAWLPTHRVVPNFLSLFTFHPEYSNTKPRPSCPAIELPHMRYIPPRYCKNILKRFAEQAPQAPLCLFSLFA